MGFFLVGRTSSGELALISPEVFGSRQEALNALTTISADPGFAHRESEVFVGNLDQATPILLVAPAAPAAEASEPASATEPESSTAEEPAPVDETVSDAGVWEAPEQEAEEGDGLAGALKRAAGALESEGIIAPDSIGPEVTAEPEAESGNELEAPDTAAAEIAWPWDAGTPAAEPDLPVGSDLEPEPDPEPEPEDATEPEPEIEPEPAIEPQPEIEPEREIEPEIEPEPEAATEPEPAIEPQPEIEPTPAVYVPDPFEEPAVDGDDIVSLRADDETVALGRPVVMGAYTETVPEVVEPASIVGTDAGEQDTAEPVDAGVDSDALDGILADLEPIEESPAGYAGSDSEEALTCADCVYEQTCPNKEGLDPSQCGNFQWKAH